MTTHVKKSNRHNMGITRKLSRYPDCNGPMCFKCNLKNYEI